MDDLERQSECSLQTLMMIFSVARSLTSNIKFSRKTKQTNKHTLSKTTAESSRNKEEEKEKKMINQFGGSFVDLKILGLTWHFWMILFRVFMTISTITTTSTWIWTQSTSITTTSTISTTTSTTTLISIVTRISH